MDPSAGCESGEGLCGFWTPPGWKERRWEAGCHGHRPWAGSQRASGQAPVVQPTAARPRGQEGAGSVCCRCPVSAICYELPPRGPPGDVLSLPGCFLTVIQQLSPVSTVCCFPSLLTRVEEGRSSLTVLCFLHPLTHSPTLVFKQHQLMLHSVLTVSVGGFPRTRFPCLASCCCPFLTTLDPRDLCCSCPASSIPAAKPQSSLESRLLCNL